MIIRTLYLIGAVLALAAATTYFFIGGNGEDSTVRMMALGIAGIVLFALGLSGNRRSNE